MKKIFIVLLLTITINAQQDTLRNYNLGEVIITSAKSNIIKSSSVIDINLQSIKQFDDNDITTPLKYFTSLQITTTSKNESKIYMRGYEQRQVAVFLDGVPIYEPYSGLIDLSNIPMSSIEKITVSKGMPSLAYGANSMGGTVNFVTMNNQEQKLSLKLESGSSHNISVGTSGGFGKFYYNLNAGYSQSDGFKIPSTNAKYQNENGGKRDNSSFEKIGGMVKLGLNNFYDFNLAYSLMIVDNQKGVPTDVYTKNPRYWKYTQWNKTINNLMFSRTLANTIRIKGNAYYETYDNVLDSYDDGTFTTQTKKYAFHSTYDDHSIGINLISDIDAINFGITRLSFAWNKDLHKEEGNFNEGFSRYEASIISTGVEQDINISEKVSGIVGLGYDLLTPIFANDSELREKSYSINGFVGINYQVMENLNAHLNVTKKSRFPTLKEFYIQTAGRDLANPDLEIEKSINTELGIVFQSSKNIILSGNIFYSSINDLINQVYLEGGLRQYQNIGKAEMKGGELRVECFSETFNFNLGYTYLNAKNLSDEKINKILEYRPEHNLSFVVDFNFLFGAELRSEILFTANNFGVDSDIRELVKMEDVFITNLRLSHRFFENYLVYVRANNIFNSYYESEYGFPQQGRELFIGILVEFQRNMQKTQ